MGEDPRQRGEGLRVDLVLLAQLHPRPPPEYRRVRGDRRGDRGGARPLVPWPFSLRQPRLTRRERGREPGRPRTRDKEREAGPESNPGGPWTAATPLGYGAWRLSLV